eukprot:TRINITY_DN667_c0_g2_i1.p1 TRINITY_DN667_c0_g2~~TRINITY_DN667_c0_g2_i1.p1  ORF type:complete len:115 (-),score=3.27 TRINITY_DN667_c0_g2_i1:382-726(-)
MYGVTAGISNPDHVHVPRVTSRSRPRGRDPNPYCGGSDTEQLEITARCHVSHHVRVTCHKSPPSYFIPPKLQLPTFILSPTIWAVAVPLAEGGRIEILNLVAFHAEIQKKKKAV